MFAVWEKYGTWPSTSYFQLLRAGRQLLDSPKQNIDCSEWWMMNQSLFWASVSLFANCCAKSFSFLYWQMSFHGTEICSCFLQCLATKGLNNWISSFFRVNPFKVQNQICWEQKELEKYLSQRERIGEASRIHLKTNPPHHHHRLFSKALFMIQASQAEKGKVSLDEFRRLVASRSLLWRNSFCKIKVCSTAGKRGVCYANSRPHQDHLNSHL